jgi:hypothetical protein
MMLLCDKTSSVGILNSFIWYHASNDVQRNGGITPFFLKIRHWMETGNYLHVKTTSAPGK